MLRPPDRGPRAIGWIAGRWIVASRSCALDRWTLDRCAFDRCVAQLRIGSLDAGRWPLLIYDMAKTLESLTRWKGPI